MIGAGKRFTIKTHCVKFVEDDSTFEAAGVGKVKRRYVMARINKHEKTKTVVDNDGNIIKEEKSESTWTIERTGEPDFIKLYTDAWVPKKSNKVCK